MTLDDLRALLAAHGPAGAEEGADLERMRARVETLEQPFSREQPWAHFTASVIVVDEAGAPRLLVRHGKSGSWFRPGSHFEPGDASVSEASAREVREETGLAVATAR